MNGSEAKPRPVPDRDSEPFWRFLLAGEFRLQRCSECQALRFPPRAICNRCFDFEARWQAVSGRGVIVSWVRTHQVFTPAFRDDVPYVVVQVALEEQPDVMMIGAWEGAAEPEPGQIVEARHVKRDTEVTLLAWAPIDR